MRYIKAAAQAKKPIAMLPKRNIIHADPHLHNSFSVSMIRVFNVKNSSIYMLISLEYINIIYANEGTIFFAFECCAAFITLLKYMANGL